MQRRETWMFLRQTQSVSHVRQSRIQVAVGVGHALSRMECTGQPRTVKEVRFGLGLELPVLAIAGLVAWGIKRKEKEKEEEMKKKQMPAELLRPYPTDTELDIMTYSESDDLITFDQELHRDPAYEAQLLEQIAEKMRFASKQAGRSLTITTIAKDATLALRIVSQLGTPLTMSQFKQLIDEIKEAKKKLIASFAS